MINKNLCAKISCEENLCEICKKVIKHDSLYCEECKLNIEVNQKEMTLEM